VKIGKKIRLIVILAIVLAMAGYAAYLYFNYFNYFEYKKYLTSYSYETGKEFVGLQDNDPKVNGMVLIAESNDLKLYTNTTTTEVAVYDKRSGEITYSNPVNRDNDPIASSGRNKVDLNSQFMLTYYDVSMTEINMYNYDYSVQRGQFTMESLDNGIRYTYMLGNLDSPTGLVPPFITEERLQEKILSKLTEKEAKNFRVNYLPSKSLEGFLELTKGAQANKVGLSKLHKLLDKAGYTQADFDEDAAAAAGGTAPERTTFTIPLEYRLVEDKLEVNIPTSHIVETGGGKLGSITLLSYFGAGSSEEKGYILVPNGSGSLINFNNGKKTERYNQYLYGPDETAPIYTGIEETEKARLPIWGIKKEKSAVFAEITSGDTLANIIANVSGGINSYNYVYPNFVIRGSEEVSVFGVSGVSADLPTLEKNIYDLNLTVDYSFLEEKSASYSGMANYYRNKLLKRGDLKVKEVQEENIPFYLDIVGGVLTERSILGVPYMGVYPMTTFDEAGTIVDSFMKNNVSNMKVNLQGWFNDGYYHDIATKIKVERILGGKGDLEKLSDKLEAAGNILYGDVAIQKIPWTSEDKFNYKLETAKYYAGYYVVNAPTNPVTLRNSSNYRETIYDVLSPKFLVRHVEKFLKAIDKVDISGVSLRDMGDMLSSDKRRTGVIDRQQAKQVVLSQLELMDKQLEHIMINGGNAYSWKYVQDLINVPTSDNPYYLVDQEVPFYQMVIHGNINYSAGAINLSDSYDKQSIILRLIEFGMAPHFTLTYQDSSNIKYSGLNSLYTTQYETWLEDAVDIYHKTNEVLKQVENSTITEHTILDSGVKKITYDNGVTIYINETRTDLSADGLTIPAMGYEIEGVE
jgi:hypothetical protein